MISYLIQHKNPSQQYIPIEVSFEPSKEIEIIHLASWRPGRYELGNFAKNIKSFHVFNEDGKALEFEKLTKDSWKIVCGESKKVRITYSYFANELNAGSSYISDVQLYVNPVNCCLFIEGREEETCEVTVDIPAHFNIAPSLPFDNKKMIAKNFDELADAPFICSSLLQHNTYTIHETVFHIWFNGEIKVDWERILGDFIKFSQKQIEKFTEFPVAEFHFLIQIVPYKAYHGVEHQHSTVILLGPTYDVFGNLYPELLGVSSHELYHTWNVKAIRPIEMFPYNFKQENYSRLGYLCEGVTTYMGDLLLYKSGVFTLNMYLAELSNQLQKHFDNFGRFNYSVAASSFDTWLDGYVPGTPNRKVSIYTEGCLLAFVTDTFILKHSKEKYCLDDVMKYLYTNFYLQGKGVSESDYQAAIEMFAGQSFEAILKDYFYNSKPFESILVDAFDYLGLELKHTVTPSYSAGKLGFKVIPQGQNLCVKAIYPGSPAELGGLVLEDEITAVNGFLCNGELEKWLGYFAEDAKTLTILRKGRIIELTLPEVNRFFFYDYSVVNLETKDHAQKRAFDYWSK
jgi:predicted metalloprotease with PDZ domain